MITLQDINNAVITKLDSLQLKTRRRYSALNRVIEYIKEAFNGDVTCLNVGKDKFIEQFKTYTGSRASADLSVIREIYRQYATLMGKRNDSENGISLTESKEVKEAITKHEDNERKKVVSFKPIVDDKSEVLILGSAPGPDSLQSGRYYDSPNNCFWKIISSIFNEGKEFKTYQEKVDCLHKNHIALWDVENTCTRIHAADDTIQDDDFNDIENLLKEYPSIRKIVLSGNKAAKNFHASVPYEKVVSSAAYIKDTEKINIWRKALSK